ncbi:MAG: hypothetical protein DRP14_01355 [Candidatus Aenigmatarchaeota archaeon]|nr:MAG: hypothetical protein DRP14_01355 [Candidatus Aenigmarchaeota archaeon]
MKEIKKGQLQLSILGSSCSTYRICLLNSGYFYLLTFKLYICYYKNKISIVEVITLISKKNVTSQKVWVKIKKLVDKLNLRCYEHNV